MTSRIKSRVNEYIVFCGKRAWNESTSFDESLQMLRRGTLRALHFHCRLEDHFR